MFQQTRTQNFKMVQDVQDGVYSRQVVYWASFQLQEHTAFTCWYKGTLAMTFLISLLKFQGTDHNRKKLRKAIPKQESRRYHETKVILSLSRISPETQKRGDFTSLLLRRGRGQISLFPSLPSPWRNPDCSRKQITVLIKSGTVNDQFLKS